MTPEGKVKELVKEVLAKYEGRIYYNMPVPGGYGKSSLDFWGFFHGLGWAVETKRPRKKPTTRQDGTIEDMRAAGAAVFVVDGSESLKQFEEWLALTEEAYCV